MQTLSTLHSACARGVPRSLLWLITSISHATSNHDSPLPLVRTRYWFYRHGISKRSRRVTKSGLSLKPSSPATSQAQGSWWESLVFKQLAMEFYLWKFDSFGGLVNIIQIILVLSTFDLRMYNQNVEATFFTVTFHLFFSFYTEYHNTAQPMFH